MSHQQSSVAFGAATSLSDLQEAPELRSCRLSLCSRSSSTPAELPGVYQGAVTHMVANSAVQCDLCGSVGTHCLPR